MPPRRRCSTKRWKRRRWSQIERPYSLDEIRYNVALRDRMRRVDIDSITFESGSWEVTPEQQPKLQAVAEAIQRVLQRNPDEVFMIEGHTDAVGNDVDNLSLSDRRAESVAVILTEVYQIPPENLVTQGYGEQHLKVPTEGPSRENRRVTMRRVTPLLKGGVASRAVIDRVRVLRASTPLRPFHTHDHSCLLAIRAPSASDLSFAQTMLGCTSFEPAKVAKPQSAPAMTFSRPTTLA